MRFMHATVTALIATALISTTASAQASRDSRSGDAVMPVMKYAKTSIYACRGRSDGFSTVKFTAANRGRTRAFVKAWADRGHHVEIGSQRLAGGHQAELGEFGTTGPLIDVSFRLVIRVNGERRTKALMGSDLPNC
jgi:hypothetical protein